MNLWEVDENELKLHSKYLANDNFPIFPRKLHQKFKISEEFFKKRSSN